MTIYKDSTCKQVILDNNWQARANEFAHDRNLDRAASVYALDMMRKSQET